MCLKFVDTIATFKSTPVITYLYIGCVLGLFCCTARLSEDKHPFKVLQATSQEWVAGARGGGRGTTYTIQIHITSASSILFDSIWINNKRLKIDIKKGGNLQQPTTLKENDTLTLLASDYAGRTTPGRKQEEKDPAATGSVPAPISYSGAALLGYSVADTKRYYVLAHMQSLPAIYGH